MPVEFMGHNAAKTLRRSAPRRHEVLGQIGYVVRPQGLAETYMYEPALGTPRQNYEPDFRYCTVEDARWRTLATCIDNEGFELWDAPSQVRDFWDSDEVATRYYPECAELALAVTGAVRAYVFDHQVRKREEGRPELSFGRAGDGGKPAALGRVHNDYSDASGLKRLRMVLPDGEAAARIGRYAIVNIWRSIAGRVVDTPLAVCDARSVSVTDVVLNTLRYHDRIGEINLYEFSDQHRWSFYSGMDRHEALVFKQFDSQAAGVARATPHVAFDLPEIPDDAPLRESIEVRCLVVYN